MYVSWPSRLRSIPWGKGSLGALTSNLLPYLNHTAPQNPKWLQKRPETKIRVRVRPLSKSFLSNLMVRDALNVKAMGIYKLIAQTRGS